MHCLRPLKRNNGHYIATKYNDTPADAAMLCSKPGVTGVVWLVFIEFKSFANSPVTNPCPVYLAAAHSAVNSLDNGAATCFMWEPIVYNAYIAMLQAAAARYDTNPRVEGIIFEESTLSLNSAASQNGADAGTYTALAWRNALIALVDAGAAAFAHSRVVSFLNFMRGGQAYLADVSAAISAVPNDQAGYSRYPISGCRRASRSQSAARSGASTPRIRARAACASTRTCSGTTPRWRARPA